ncbi:MAG: fatty acid desaturase [Panacagrimonas sp.]|jgi:fatty acid desaturase|nr:fatty acid desaturase family protein [Panacagrimonas sp.]MCC2656660.1 fatty acid desaturase [Panacagrimonas sp.]
MNGSTPWDEDRVRPGDLLTREQIRALTHRSDLGGWLTVLWTWTTIAAIFVMLALWPNAFTFVLAVVLLGGRQLALFIVAHDAAHRTLFRTRRLNDVVGDWLAARFIFNDVRRYREHHMRHHAHTGTDGDPDLSLVRPFPTTRRSLAKRFLRDLTGQTGVRRLAAQFLMDIGVFGYTVAAEVEHLPNAGRTTRDYVRAGLRNFAPSLIAQLALLGVLAALGHAWLYGAWAVAYMTTFSLYVRIRSMAEHACMEMSPHPLRNTRTARAGLFARMTLAPLNVNYHREHHLMASVPWYRLPALQRALREQGLGRGESLPGYADVLRLVGSRG